MSAASRANLRHTQTQQLVGEISQLKAATKRFQNDLGEYKNIQAQYLDSLVKYKVGVWHRRNQGQQLDATCSCRREPWRTTTWTNMVKLWISESSSTRWEMGDMLLI
jgi:hypothetical protein